MAEPGRVVVLLPESIVRSLAEIPRENSHYEEGRINSLRWVSILCSLDEKSITKIDKGDLTYFAAACAPNAGLERYLVFCDWVNWVFPFDDQYDDGPMRDSPEAAQVELENWIESVHTDVEPLTKFVKAHQDTWSRFKEDASQVTLRRFQIMITDFANAIGVQVQNSARDLLPSPLEVLRIRRASAGSWALFVLMEYAENIALPQEVFDHPAIKQMEDAANDQILIVNDILSYAKEESEEVFHNIVAACRHQGMSPQEAFDYLEKMLQDRETKFREARSNVP